MAEHSPARHDLMWLEAGAAARARPLPGCSAGLHDAAGALAAWIAADRPLVVARQPGERAPGRIVLGLPLPPSAGKHRIAFDIPLAQVRRRAPPPPLSAIASLLPDEWQTTLQTLTTHPDIVATAPRAFGSAAMQAITGTTCLGEDSDLDLLLKPTSRAAAERALDALGALVAQGCRPRLDGEMLDRHGRATSWRELLSGAKQVLFKHTERIGMTRREDFLEACEASAT